MRFAIFAAAPCCVVSALSGPVHAQELAAERPRLSGALTLKDAVTFGLRENLSLRAASRQAGAARAQSRAARGMSSPQLSLHAYGKIGDMEALMPSAPGVMPANTALLPPRAGADLNLTAMAPIFTGGLLANQIKAAEEMARAESAMAEASRAEIALRIREAYYGALLQGELAKAEQSRVDSAREMVRTTTARFEAGRDIQASVHRSESELADADRERTMRENERAKMLLNLLAEMGASLDSAITLGDALQFSEVTQDLTAYLLEAQRTRPDVVAARARLASAEARVKMAEASRRPQVYGMAMLDGFASREMSPGVGYTVGAVASLALFDAGQRRSEIQQMLEMRGAAEAEMREMELRAAAEVRQAWLDLETATKNYTSSISAQRGAESAFEAIRLRVEAGRSIMLEQLEALASITKARANVARALYEHSIARAKLLRAVGRTQ